MIPATFDTSGGFATDRSAGFGQRAAHAPLPDRDDLGHDADRHLFGRARADVKADRTANPRKGVVGDTGIPQPLAPVPVRLATADRADVRSFGVERADQCRL